MVVLMFKIMVLQALYGLSDDQAEFQIQDRLSFMRFLGLGLGDRVPDAKTIWLFREHLTQDQAVENLFTRFDKYLTKVGYLAMGGQIVDATIVAAPKQRNSNGEKADIKAGKVLEPWQDKPAKLRQKDRDARWTVKFSKAKAEEDGTLKQRDIAVPAFGYKNHTSIDGTASSVAGTSPARLPGTVRCFPTCWTRTTPARQCGPTRPIVQRKIRRGWRSMVISLTSTTRSRRGGR